VSARSLARYARAIERRWSEFLGGPTVLSPGDWRWITEWYERGIPLALVFDCLEEAAERRRAGRGARRPRGLSYLAPAVRESWSAVLEGQVEEPERQAGAAGPAPREAWRRRIGEEPPGSRLRTLLEGLLAKLQSAVDPAAVEDELERELPGAIPESVRVAAEREARDWLEGHRSRLGEAGFEAAVSRALLLRLRRRLHLPRLTDDEGTEEDDLE
jgi:hypothetical protein